MTSTRLELNYLLHMVCLLALGVSAPCPGATISISKDVRFTAGAPHILYQGTAAPPALVSATSDGGRLVLAYLASPGRADLFVSRLDAAGATLWEQNIGGTNFTQHFAIENGVTETENGNVLVL